MTHVLITLFSCYPQTVQRLLWIEGGTEISYCTPVTPQFHGMGKTQRPHCCIHTGIFHGVSEAVAFWAGMERVEKDCSGRAPCWCGFFQS